MTSRNRDLLVLARKEKMSRQEFEHEVELLNDLFYFIECSNAIYVANEVIDVNRFKVITKHYKVRQILKEERLKPFVFISNKN